jgi:hypothetical protein
LVRIENLIDFKQTITLTLAAKLDALEGAQSFRLTIQESGDDYDLAPAGGIKVDVADRRYLYSQAVFNIYEGVVVATKYGQPDPAPVDATDLVQVIGDCYFVAALIAAVRKDAAQIENLIQPKPDGTFDVSFPGASQTFNVSGGLDRGGEMIGLQNADRDENGNIEIWPALIEHAYALLRASRVGAPADQAFYEIGNGVAATAWIDLTGGSATTTATSLGEIIAHRNAGSSRQVMISTQGYSGDGPDPGPPFGGFNANHVYVLNDVIGNSVQLIDPLGGPMQTVPLNVFTRPQEWSWRFEGDFVGILPSWMMSGQDR